MRRWVALYLDCMSFFRDYRPVNQGIFKARFSRSLVHSGSRVGDHCRTSAVGRRGTASGRPRWAPAFPGIRCTVRKYVAAAQREGIARDGPAHKPPHRPLTRGSRRWPRKRVVHLERPVQVPGIHLPLFEKPVHLPHTHRQPLPDSKTG